MKYEYGPALLAVGNVTGMILKLPTICELTHNVTWLAAWMWIRCTMHQRSGRHSTCGIGLPPSWGGIRND